MPGVTLEHAAKVQSRPPHTRMTIQGKHLLPSLALLLLGLPCSVSAWVLSTPAYTMTLSDGLWTLQDSVTHDTVNRVTNHSGYPVELLGRPLSGSVDLDREASQRAADILPVQGAPAKIWDSVEVQGAHSFRVAEWRDTSAMAGDPSLRARTYALHQDGILFIATLRYRPGGCPSTLYTLRVALATLTLMDTAPIRRQFASKPSWDAPHPPAKERDALGRLRRAGPTLQKLFPPGSIRAGYTPVSKAARLQGLPQPLPYHGCADPPP